MCVCVWINREKKKHRNKKKKELMKDRDIHSERHHDLDRKKDGKFEKKKKQFKKTIFYHGSLTEGEDSVQSTSLYYIILISSVLY